MLGIRLIMPYILDRFEDNDLVVLETDGGTTLDVPRVQIPPEAKEGDVLLELAKSELDGEVRYAVDFDATKQRRREASDLRASISTVEAGDIEL